MKRDRTSDLRRQEEWRQRVRLTEALVATAHAAFKDETPYESARVVVEARNIVRPSPAFQLVKA